MFEFRKEDKDFGELLFLKNKTTGEEFSIIPRFGSNLNSLSLKAKNGELFNIIKGKKRKEEFSKDKIYNGALLFPFPNRLKNGVYFHNTEKYELKRNNHPNALHGLLYDKEFELDEIYSGNKKGFLKLKYFSDGSLKGYPFKFGIINKFELSKEGVFSLLTEVINVDNCNIPVGFGWHPYFNLGSKTDYNYLRLPETYKIEVDENLIPTGEKFDYIYFNKLEKIGNTEFDTCFMMKNNNLSNKITFSCKDRKQNLTIEFPEGSNYKYFQLYIPPQRDEIAIEPMSCNIDALNNKEGLIDLMANEKVSFNFRVYFNGDK